jgi:hypothetical protein
LFGNAQLLTNVVENSTVGLVLIALSLDPGLKL